jgi:nicotinamidase/pyrazinamidase
MQGDFTTWKKGSLAVNGTDRHYVDKVQEATQKFHEEGCLIFATQDWHPADHVSFFTNHSGAEPFEVIEIDGRTQVLWPPHCIQGTENARILVDNNIFMAVVQKGKDPRYDSYSGFQDDGGGQTELDSILKRNDIRNLLVYGLAADVCVKATALDALDAGYRVTVIENLSRGVVPENTETALNEMRERGITIWKELE